MKETDLKSAVTALIRQVAGAEEGALLSQPPPERESQGSPDAWSLTAVVAHNCEFKGQQVTRLKAARDRSVPPTFQEVDHGSAEVYDGFARAGWEEVLAASRAVTAELLDLWLQVVVRGFWHPGSHLGEFWLAHGQPDRTLHLHQAGVALAEVMEVPPSAVGMGRYALACALARSGNPQFALEELLAATEANPDLAQNAGRDPDLSTVRALSGWTALGK